MTSILKHGVPKECVISQYSHSMLRGHLSKLDIDFAGGYPKFHRNARGQLVAVQLREIDLDTCGLIIGCGNHPTSKLYTLDCDVRELEDYVSEAFPEDSQDGMRVAILRGCHGHEGYVTLDMDLTMNPTIWCNVEVEGCLDFIPHELFPEIVLEGQGIDEDAEQYLRQFAKDPDSEIVQDVYGEHETVRSDCRACMAVIEDYHERSLEETSSGAELSEVDE